MNSTVWDKNQIIEQRIIGFMPSKEHETSAEQAEKKRTEFNRHVAEQYAKKGNLSSSTLLQESSDLDGQLNKQVLEERLAQYRLEENGEREGT